MQAGHGIESEPEGELLPRGTLAVPAPIARIGDQVSVRNFRRSDAPWEDGFVFQEPDCQMSAHLPEGCYWTYAVRLHRKSTRGGYVDLHVGDDAIRRRA